MSEKATIGILRRAAKRGKELPPVLRMALEQQSNIRRDSFGKEEITHASNLLRELWKSVSQTSFEEWIRGAVILVQQEKVLFLEVHGGGELEKTEESENETIGKRSGKSDNATNGLHQLWKIGASGNPPQGFKPPEQLARELSEAMSEVSRQTAPSNTFMQCLWEASEEEGILRESLSDIYAEAQGRTIYEITRGACKSNTEYLTGWDIQSERIFTTNGVTPTLGGCDGGGGRIGGSIGYIAESQEARKEVAGGIGDGVEAASKPIALGKIAGCLSCGAHPGGFNGQDAYSNHLIVQPSELYESHPMDGRVKGPLLVSPTVTAKYAKGCADTPLITCATKQLSQNIGYDVAMPLMESDYKEPQAVLVPLMVENHPADSRVKIDDTGTTQTLTSRMGTGGGNVPMIMQPIAFNTFGGNKRVDRPNGGFYVDIPAESSKPLDTNGTSLTTQQGGTGVLEPTYAFCPEQSAKTRGIGFQEECSPTLRAEGATPAIVFAINQRDEVRDLGDKSGALQAQPGMKQQTFIAQATIGFNASSRPGSGWAPASFAEGENVSPTLTVKTATAVAYAQAFGPGGNSEVSHAIRAQPSKADKPSSTTYIVEPAYATQSGTMPNKSQNGLGVAEELMYTLDTRADHAVAHAVDVRNLNETEELSGTLQSKNSGRYSLNYQNPVRIGYRVRRLTPTECLRLQGFPDNWLDIEGASDSAKYKAVGNSVAEPCPNFIFERVMKVLRGGRQQCQ